VKGFIKASLEGWRDTVANPKEAADIVVKHIKGLDPEVAFQEIAIVNALVATPATRSKGLGIIDDKLMQSSVELIAKGIGAEGKVAAKDTYDTSALPNPPIKP
jgi:NitT/TauT family transport system substrate-binding protein